MLQKQVYTMIRKIVTLTFIISGCSGLIHGAFFNCSNYTFHENSTEGRSWETSRSLCQNSSEGDLVSIEEEEERNFVKNVIEKLAPIKYFIGLKKENGKWKWLTNRTKVHESKGKSPWALGEPSGTSIRGRKVNCATIYGNYMHDLGRFDDMSCRRRTKNAGHICERAVSCTKDERGTILKKKPTEVTSVHSTATTLSQVGLPSGHHTTEIESTSSRPRATKEQKKATPVRSTARTAWKNQPFLSTAETDSIAPVTTHLEKADESSNLIPIIVSALAAFVILGTCVALLLFLVYLPRKKGSNLKIQRYQRQSSSIKLIGLDRLSLAEQEMDDCESLPEVKDAYVTIEERDGGSFLSMQASSTITPREALIEEQSSANSYSDPLPISARTKPSKVVVKKDKPEQHQVYVHIHSKKDNAAFHFDHVMQHVGEWPSQVIVDEENCKPSAAISSVGLEKESVTREQDAIVKQNASGQDQCNDCVYAVVDKTMKKRQPGKKPAPYQELVYADLSHSPKKSKNGKIHQESTATIYADIDHIKSSAMSDSTSQQENEVKLID